MSQPYMLCPATGSDQADEWLRLGLAAQVAGKLPEAQQHYQQALRLDPRHSLSMNNLAIVFAQSNLLNEALLTIERAAMCDPKHGITHLNWSLMALAAEHVDVALAMAQKAVEIAPEEISSLLALAIVCASAGMPEHSVPLYNKMLDKEPKHIQAGANACFVQTLTKATPAELLWQRQRWYNANKFTGKIEQHRNDRDPERTLRVGYVGGDFKSHSAAFIFANALLNHSPAVEMYLYSTLPDMNPEVDGRTKKFMTAVGDRWRDISAITDEDADRLIRKDKIDILVDLAAHTNGGRLALFTRKPAPIQVTAWGFAHGTGLPEIDYFFADPIAVPAEERQHYAEKVIDLPCIVTMDPPVDYNLNGVSHLPLWKNNYITFGAYARYEKMSDECVQTMAEILRRVPDSKLQFKDNAYRRPYSLRRIMRLMPDIAPERLLFSLATPHTDHMLTYQQADICLDPFPHGGGVVALEQIYMGVPLVTLSGTQAAGRSGASVLSLLGRGDWVAKTPQEYVDIAVRLAEDPQQLAAQRKVLRKDLLASPVVAGYAAAVEQTYRQIWRTWCES